MTDIHSSQITLIKECSVAERTTFIQQEHVSERKQLFTDTYQKARNPSLLLNVATNSQTVKIAPPGNTIDPDYLNKLATAFAAAYTVMANTAASGANQYAQLQQLDQTMSSSVLASTKNAIDKEANALKVEQHLAYEQKEAEDRADLLNKIFMGVGIAAMVLVAASVLVGDFAAPAILTGLFTTTATTETPVAAAGAAGLLAGTAVNTTADASLTAASTTAAVGAGGAQVGGDVATTASTLGDLATEAGGDLAETGTESLVNATDGVDVTEEGGDLEETTTRQTNRALEQGSKANQQSEESFARKLAKWLGKRIIGGALAAGFDSPQLINGLAQLKISSSMDEAGDAEKMVGPATAALEMNNMYYRFYQQLIQRSIPLVQEELNNANEIVSTLGDIMEAYRQIPQNLANPV